MPLFFVTCYKEKHIEKIWSGFLPTTPFVFISKSEEFRYFFFFFFFFFWQIWKDLVIQWNPDPSNKYGNIISDLER